MKNFSCHTGKGEFFKNKTLMSDEEYLEKFKNHYNDLVRISIIYKLSDEKLIFDNFKDDENWSVRLNVVKKLTNINLLKYFTKDKSYLVQSSAKEKIKKQKVA